jgi:hypothetical protein
MKKNTTPTLSSIILIRGIIVVYQITTLYTVLSSIISHYISVPLLSQSQSTFYNHNSTHTPLHLLFLPLRVQLMAEILLQMISPTVGKSKLSVHVVGNVVFHMAYKYEGHWSN